MNDYMLKLKDYFKKLISLLSLLPPIFKENYEGQCPYEKKRVSFFFIIFF